MTQKEMLKQFRKTARADGVPISQKTAAGLFGVSLRTWANWESEEYKVPPPGLILLQVFERYGIDLLD